VRRTYIRESGEQIAVGPYLVLRYLPIFHDANERIEGIVGKCPTVVGKGCRTRGIIGQEIWEQCACDALCIRRRISTGVLERVREAGKCDMDHFSFEEVNDRLDTLVQIGWASRNALRTRYTVAITPEAREATYWTIVSIDTSNSFTNR